MIPFISEQQIIALFCAFSKSNYGKKLLNRTRFSYFQPDFASNKDWIKILGRDADNLLHMLITQNHAEDFVEQCNNEPCYGLTFSKRERLILFLAAVSHDWGEAIVGDINLRYKTKDDEINEKEAFSKICREINKECTRFNASSALRFVNENIIFNNKSKLGNVFWAIENIGYLSTAIRSWKESFKHPELQLYLQWLSTDVLRSLPSFLCLANQYEPVKKVLRENRKTITNILNYDTGKILELYNGQIRSKITKDLNKSRMYWSVIS